MRDLAVALGYRERAGGAAGAQSGEGRRGGYRGAVMLARAGEGWREPVLRRRRRGECRRSRDVTNQAADVAEKCCHGDERLGQGGEGASGEAANDARTQHAWRISGEADRRATIQETP